MVKINRVSFLSFSCKELKISTFFLNQPFCDTKIHIIRKFYQKINSFAKFVPKKPFFQIFNLQDGWLIFVNMSLTMLAIFNQRFDVISRKVEEKGPYGALFATLSEATIRIVQN